ncbi:MAG: hypothetical protein SWX82_33200 [Cyanobacteriota bacterium]|nr:hypothetical protein [Cyanobacteriota bacterium]
MAKKGCKSWEFKSFGSAISVISYQLSVLCLFARNSNTVVPVDCGFGAIALNKAHQYH